MQRFPIDDFGQYVEATITDADLDADSTSFDGLIEVSVENDVPTLEASGDAVGGAVQEDALDNSQSVGNPDDASDTTIATFGLSGLVADPNSAPGADEDVTYHLCDGDRSDPVVSAGSFGTDIERREHLVLQQRRSTRGPSGRRFWIGGPGGIHVWRRRDDRRGYVHVSGPVGSPLMIRETMQRFRLTILASM